MNNHFLDCNNSLVITLIYSIDNAYRNGLNKILLVLYAGLLPPSPNLVLVISVVIARVLCFYPHWLSYVF